MRDALTNFRPSYAGGVSPSFGDGRGEAHTAGAQASSDPGFMTPPPRMTGHLPSEAGEEEKSGSANV